MAALHRNRQTVNTYQAGRLFYVVRALLAWFAQSARDLPWRRARDPYAIWISEIMLQQTQVKTVVPYWEGWMRELPTVETLADAKPEKILKLWEGLGYYTRARNLHQAAQMVVSKHGGNFPSRFDDVLALPGIGRYTAGAICSIAFNQPTPILDGNVIRVLCRLFGLGEDPRGKKTNAKLWSIAQELVSVAAGLKLPAENGLTCSLFNQSLMELGALVCTPRQPKCELCPLNSRCVARRDGLVERLPKVSKRVAPTQRRFIAFIIEDRGRFLVRQRPAGVANAHLWEFPNVEVRLSFVETPHPIPLPLGGGEGARRAGEGDVKDPTRIKSQSSHPELKRLASTKLSLRLTSLRPLRVVKHSITRYRITLEAHQARLESPRQRNGEAGCWLPPSRLAALAFTSAHRKLLEAALGRLDANRSPEPAKNVAAEVTRRTKHPELLGESASSRRRLRSLPSAPTDR